MTATPASTAATTSSDSIRRGSSATIMVPATTPGTRPTSAQPAPRTSSDAPSCTSTAVVTQHASTRFTDGTSDASTIARTGAAIIPSPNPIDTCSSAPTMTPAHIKENPRTLTPDGATRPA